MAYRFNPPPNWPVDEPNWTPPPGWQPDPSWGPAPEGWTFWVEDEEQAAAPQQSEPVVEGTPAGSDAEPAPAAPEPSTVADPAAATGLADQEATGGRHAADPADGTPAAAPQPLAEESTPGQDAPAHHGAHEAPSHEPSSHEAGADEAGADDESPQTAEYTGPDLDADLATSAPYESTAQDTGASTDPAPSADGQEGSSAGYGAAGAAAVGGAGLAAGGVAASQHSGDTQGSQDAAGAEPASTDPAAGYGAPSDGSAAPDDGTAAPADGAEPSAYGSAAPAYGSVAPADGSAGAEAPAPAPEAGTSAPPNEFSQASAAPAYGSEAPAYGSDAPAYGADASGYGADSAAGQPSPYGQGSPAAAPGGDYPAAGSPTTGGQDSTSATGGGEPPKKGFVARFWWLGCIILVVVLALIAAIGVGVWMMNRDEPDAPPSSSASQESGSAEETPAESATADGSVTPSVLPTVAEGAEEQDVVSSDGTGSLAVSMEWAAAEDLPSQYGGTVTPGEVQDGGGYLAVTAQITVTDGSMDLQPYMFTLKTPYGGDISPATATYELADSGLATDAPTTFEAGEEYTITLLFDCRQTGDLQLEYNTFSDAYTWDVAA